MLERLKNKYRWWINWPPKEAPSPEIKAVAEYFGEGLKLMCSLPPVNFTLGERKGKVVEDD